jgi:tRNA dimethylallyltransferase
MLVGPTGVGKTEVAFRTAERLGGEIVSADSRLFYRMMDIGTAKPSSQMMKQIPHHLIDVVDPDESYTCKRFERDARDAVRGILARKRIPVVVGGSGLYVRALTDGIFEGPEADQDLRRKLRAEAAERGTARLWARLQAVDRKKAAQVDPENLVRIIRALEVYELTGRRMSELEQQAVPFEVPCMKIGLTRKRSELYRMIDQRVDRMMEAGFLYEVKRLADRGYGDNLTVGGSLGYRELIAHIGGETTLTDAVDSIKRNTRHFAKRQITWFRRDPKITWIDITEGDDVDKIADEVITRFRLR